VFINLSKSVETELVHFETCYLKFNCVVIIFRKSVETEIVDVETFK